MSDKKQIQEWLDLGVITQEQAEKMFLDMERKNKEKRSMKFIVAMSTIGSVLLGLGAISFIAANWIMMPDLMKVVVILGVTFSAYYFGFRFRYDKGNLPKVGASLFFLGALLFGASVFLIAQIYHISANSDFLLLVWLIGILPLVYAFQSEPIAVLSAVLFLFLFLRVLLGGRFFDEAVIFFLPVIYLSTGLLLFVVGSFHYLQSRLIKVARVFRIIGIQVAMASLFVLTFGFFSGGNNFWFNRMRSFDDVVPQLMTVVVSLVVLVFFALVANLFYNPSRSKTNSFENGIPLVLLLFTLLYFFFPLQSNIYTVVFNLFFAGLTLFLIYIGYQRADIKILNMGVFWFFIFIIAKYFDLFWRLMDKALFFIVGGLILVVGGIFLEKKRVQIKKSFTKSNL